MTGTLLLRALEEAEADAPLPDVSAETPIVMGGPRRDTSGAAGKHGQSTELRDARQQLERPRIRLPVKVLLERPLEDRT